MKTMTRATTGPVPAPRTVRKRVLIVNVFFDEYRHTTGSRYRGWVMRQVMGFLAHYRGRLTPLQLYSAVLNGALICMETFASSPNGIGSQRPRQPYLAGTEVLDPEYTPMIRVDANFEDHFRPTMVTDENGPLSVDLAEDLSV